jgi:uncharacterized protein YifE (UPF0438 family)
MDTGKVKDEPDELTNQMQWLAIEVDIKAPWVKAWGRYRKTAKRSKFGVNTAPLKKTVADGLKLKFKRIKKEKNRWASVPRKLKEGKPPQRKSKPDNGELCFATFKEQQNLEKYGKSMKQEGVKEKTPEKDKRTYPPL